MDGQQNLASWNKKFGIKNFARPLPTIIDNASSMVHHYYHVCLDGEGT